MKKIFFYMLIIFIMSFAQSFADPFYTRDIKVSGIGVVELSEDVTVYEKPDFDSKQLMTLEVAQKTSNVMMMNEKTSNYYFLAQNPSKKQAYLVVIDELDNGWVQVCYCQKEKLIGWIKPSSKNIQSWRDFYTYWGRKNGLYIFKDIQTEDRKLYAKPFDDPEDAKLVAQYTNIYKMKLVYIKGNWMLVRVLDVGGDEKIGFMRWRDVDGKLFMFPITK